MYKAIIKTQNDENDRLRKHIVLVEYEIDLTKDIVEELGANTCKVSFDAEIVVIEENKKLN